MKRLLAIVIALVENWTRFYTSGLPVGPREDRRAEIECDLWEQQRHAGREAIPATATALDILIRWVTGMPADVVWRLESGARARAERRSSAVSTSSRTMQILTAAAFVVIGLIGFSGIAIMVNGWQHERDWIWMLWGAIPLFLGMPAIFGGMLSTPAHPVRGLMLVVVGVLITAIVWFWLFIITIPLGLGLIALSYLRAKRAGWRSGPQLVAPNG